jgi:hypothetical protein
MDEFDKFGQQFDRAFKRAIGATVALAAAWFVVSALVLAGVAWVAVQVLHHFGVI